VWSIDTNDSSPEPLEQVSHSVGVCGVWKSGVAGSGRAALLASRLSSEQGGVINWDEQGVVIGSHRSVSGFDSGREWDSHTQGDLGRAGWT
jgi:hypothetical protein